MSIFTESAPAPPSVAEQIIDDVVGLIVDRIGTHFHDDIDAIGWCDDCQAVLDEIAFDTLGVLQNILEEAEENHAPAEVPA